MNIKDLKSDNRHGDWYLYEPLDAQYVRYIKDNPSALAAGHKIDDVYHTFCDARGSMMSVDYENYGDLCANDEFSILYTKSKFLKLALIDYAICLDLSWQVIWAYIQPSSFAYLVNQNYKEMEQWCDGETVHTQLNCVISQQKSGDEQMQEDSEAIKIKELLTKFENDNVVIKVRKIYNSLKHRGTLHFKELEDEDLYKFYFDKSVELPLQREAYSIEEIQSLLLEYHDRFVDYFNELIGIIMPVDYMVNRAGVVDYKLIVSEISKIQNAPN